MTDPMTLLALHYGIQQRPLPETTQLSPRQEADFQAWARRNGISDVDAPDSHYDYRGFWKSSGGPAMQFGRVHFPDTYKQHGHPTFSVESQYSTGGTDGGSWDGERFVPAPRGSSHLSPQAPGAWRENAIPLAPLTVTGRRR